jgi:hypothetical protein
MGIQFRKDIYGHDERLGWINYFEAIILEYL